MKIKQIKIKNFRSLKNIEIKANDILALVGRNNSGKSNVLKALELFFKNSSSLISKESFYNKNDDETISISLTFELEDWEKEKLNSWMLDDKLIVTKNFFKDGNSYKIKNFVVKKVPVMEWLQSDIVSTNKINDWWAEKNTLKIGDKNFLDEIGTRKPTGSKWKQGISQFLEKYSEEIQMEIKPLETPSAFDKEFKATLPQFILVPAVRNVTDEAKVGKTNPFGQLINSLFKKIPEDEKEKLSIQLKHVEDQLDTSSGLSTINEIKEIEDNLNSLMCEFMECDIKIKAPVPQLEEIINNTNIYADDGVETRIEYKGHGMQRSMIFTILRAYAELNNRSDTGNAGNERATIFAIEEPELYLHPQSQRTLMSILEDIANGIDQAIYCTHSSLFIDISHFDNICIMRMDNKESIPTQLYMSAMLEDLKARHGDVGSDFSIRELYSNAFNEMINEGFFASKVIIAEGPSELYSLPIYANILNYNFDKNNVSIVHAGGKGPIDRLLRIFNGFKIPFYVIFDGDKNNDNADIKNKTLELLELLGHPIDKIEDIETTISDDFTVLELNFEDTLKKELEDYDDLWKKAADDLGPTGKPLKHRYIAKAIEKRIDEGKELNDEVPNTVIQVINKIESLSNQDSFLHKLEETEGN